jgi:hypothetical protein
LKISTEATLAASPLTIRNAFYADKSAAAAAPAPQSFLNELTLKTATGKFGKTLLPLLNKSTHTLLVNPSHSGFLFSKFLQRGSNPALLLPAVNLSEVK